MVVSRGIIRLLVVLYCDRIWLKNYIMSYPIFGGSVDENVEAGGPYSIIMIFEYTAYRYDIGCILL